MKKDRLTVLFYRRSTVTKTGECAIRMRISVNGTRIDSNTGKYIDPALWNQSKERAKGTSKNAIDVNDYIDETNIKLFRAVSGNAVGRSCRNRSGTSQTDFSISVSIRLWNV